MPGEYEILILLTEGQFAESFNLDPHTGLSTFTDFGIWGEFVSPSYPINSRLPLQGQSEPFNKCHRGLFVY